MKQKLIAILLTFALVLTLAACGGGEETTLSGMVVAVDGTVISVMEMGEMNFDRGERPQMPEGMEDFQGFGDFNPEDFEGTLPEDFEGTLPEGFEGSFPEGFEGGFPGGMPEDFGGTLPEGETFPQRGEGQMPGGMMGGFSGSMETTDVDISDAHISMESDGVKTSAAMEDIQPGTFVTITLNAKGQATYVLLTETSVFGGRMPRS